MSEASFEVQQVSEELHKGHAPPGSCVDRLLAAFQDVLEVANELPPVVVVRSRHRLSGSVSRFRALPRPRWFLRYLILRHIDNTLTALRRRYYARAALGRTADFDEHDRQVIEDFRQSLPPLRTKTYTIALALATLVLAQSMVTGVAIVAANVESNSLTSQPAPHSDLPGLRQANELNRKLSEAFSTSPTTVSEAFDALETAGPRSALLVVVGTSLALYALLRLLTPAFRLKRMLFNLYPEVRQYWNSTTARWHVTHETGVYELENAAYRALGVGPRREVPFDLIVVGLFLLCPLFFATLVLRDAFMIAHTHGQVSDDTITNAIVTDVILVGLGISVISLRTGWLVRTWHRRRSGRQGPYMPYYVRLRGSSSVTYVQNPIVVGGLAALWLFIAFPLPIVAALWWYRINRELRDFGLAHGTDGLGRSRRSPVVAALALFPGFALILPPFVSVYRTCCRIQTAQKIAQQPKQLPSPWLFTLGLVPYLLPVPLIAWYLQKVLNEIWVAAGDPLPDCSPLASSGAGHSIAPI